MKVINDVTTWQQIRKTLPNTKSIGFIPTMGCLHEGHASLIKRSKDENDITVLSIFVNPTQFNESSDFVHYPQTPDADLALAKKLAVDYILMPNKDDLYPDHYLTKITTSEPLALIMEGKYRPGHFDGVLTIVMKLLLLVRANNAYFGEKDYQQYKLIQSMAHAFFIETKIIPCPIIRENNSSLALSSRNNRLNQAQKKLAETYADIFNQNKENPELIKTKLTDLGITVEYIQQHENHLLSAVKIDDIRLIDNVAL